MPSLWERVADLPLTVSTLALDKLDAGATYGSERVTTLVRLGGPDGLEGLGEDVGSMPPESDAFRALAGALDVTGHWTLATFADHVAGLDLWPQPPDWEKATRFRAWALESAALDLALQQAGLPLHEALGREPRPLTFVNSFPLGEPPDPGKVVRRRKANPTVGFKLDVEVSWTREVIEQVAAVDGVRIIDFKGCYGIPYDDEDALIAMYDRTLEAFSSDDVILEDPHDLPAIVERLAPISHRVSYDAPILCVADLAKRPYDDLRVVNIKPGRLGSWRELFALYEHCEAHGLRAYGGGMGELGPARGQIQLLASIFHPDTPNDTAPSIFNELADHPDLPGSPLDPAPAPTGFRRAER